MTICLSPYFYKQAVPDAGERLFINRLIRACCTKIKPNMIDEIEEITEILGKYVREVLKGKISPQDYELLFRLYGKDGVEGETEPCQRKAHELGVITKVVAKT